MRTFWGDLNPEARDNEIWHSLLPARPIEGCPGAWELKGPPGQRGSWRHFGVDPGEALAMSDARLLVQVRRHDERNPPDAFGGALILEYVMAARSGRNICTMFDAVLTPAIPGASLIVTVWDAHTRRLAEGVQVRAR